MLSTFELLLAPFLLYSLLASGVSCAVVYIVVRVFNPLPRTRVFLHIGVLVAPILTYAVYLTHMWRSGNADFAVFYTRLCAISAQYASALAPLTLMLLAPYLGYRYLLHVRSPLRAKEKSGNKAYIGRVSKIVQSTSLRNDVHVEVWENCYPSASLRGLRSPVLAITTGLLDLLDEDELRGVISHELAHATARDNYLNWVFLFKEVVFFSPVAHYAYAEFLQAREEAADRLATANFEEQRFALASALVKVVKRAQELLQLAHVNPAHSYFYRTAGVTRRAELLVSGEPRYSTMPAVYPLIALFALVMLIC